MSAISPHVTKKLNYNYDSTVSSLNDAIKQADKKQRGFTNSKAEKRHLCLKTLFFFKPEIEVVQNLLTRMS